MIIVRTATWPNSEEEMLNKFPNQLVSDITKESPSWMKSSIDYFYNVAISQYNANKPLRRNYELVKGILKKEDFENHPEVKRFQIDSFVETLAQEELPNYIKHYSILTPAINTLLGELSKRPDNVIVRAFDADSQAEELRYKTKLLQDYTVQSVLNRVQLMYGDTPDQIEEISQKELVDQLSSYTSMAERWGTRVIEGLKVRLNMKDKSEEAFRDLLIAARQFYHIYEDDSTLGLNIEVCNPANVWFLTTTNKKYISDPYDRTNSVYAAGTIDVMEMSEIITRFNLTEKEILHLQELTNSTYLINAKSNLNTTKRGIDSIDYTTYDPLVLRERLMADSILESQQRSEWDNLFGITNDIGVFGNKFTVLQCYWASKKKIGSLTYIDEDGVEQSIFVDETYKSKTHPQQISLEWGYVNQWYKGLKIGTDIYYVEPFELLDYCPIIGSLFEPKNVRPISMVDLMKPFQMMYNIAVNQLYKLLEKDMGVVFLMNYRHVPTLKDMDPQDALEMWESQAREKGMIFIDDSPENAQSPSHFNQYTKQDLSRANEIQARYNLAVQMRNECWKLVGLSEQRLGSVQASETATATNSALAQSYAQTEPLFTHHYYTLNKAYQALLEGCQYLESTKDVSSLSFLTSEGEHSFIQVNGNELKLKDLWVFVTDRGEDQKSLEEMRSLAQAMLQNGATPYEISELYDTKSLRKMKSIFKELKDYQDQMQQQEQQTQQQQLQQQQAQFEQQQQLIELQAEKQQAFDAYQAEQDRISAEKIASISAAAKKNAPQDATQFDNELNSAYTDYQLKVQELTQKQQALLSSHTLQSEKLKVEREKMANDLKIAQTNKANKPKPKK